MRETIADRMDAIETIVGQAEALRAKAKQWAGDDLEDFLHYMDEAIGACNARLNQLFDELPHYERGYTSSRAL